MKNQEKVQIFIDGGNFHHLLLKKLKLKELDFLFDEFAKFLANGRMITEAGKRYYIGTVREQAGNIKSKESMAQQQKLFAQLWPLGWQTKTSKLRFREERVIIDDRTVDYKRILRKGIKQIEYHRFREKGIDVKIATDLIIGALDNKYDTAIIVSSDTDLIPAIDIVRKRFKKRVEYVGFSIIDETAQQEDSKSSIGMITKSDVQRILVKSDIAGFIKDWK